MSVKWRNKIFKASIVSLAFLLTINPLDFNSVIMANEDVKKEKILNNDRSIEFKNNQGDTDIIDGNIDMKQLFEFKGIGRKNSTLTVIRDIDQTASFIDERDSKLKTPNTAKILTSPSVGGRNDHHRQTVLANSTMSVNLRRDFEIQGSFAMNKKDYQGFVFAVHGDKGYQPQGTDDSLGVYSNGKNDYTNPTGLDQAFVMEVDTYANSGNHGDNFARNKNHIGYYETGINGQLKYDGRNFTLGKNLRTVNLNDNLDPYLFTKINAAGQNNHVFFTFTWNASNSRGSLSFNDNKLSQYNLSESYIDVLNKLKSKGDGSAYISIGGTTDIAGSNFMEVGVHRIKYNDIIPNVRTEVKTMDGRDLTAVYPGQHIRVKHYIQNKKNLNFDVNDNVKLFMLYLQFLNDDEIKGTISANKNFEPERVKKTIENGNGVVEELGYHPGKFDGSNPIDIIFPRNSLYYVLEYDVVVPTSVDKDSNYNKNFSLFFQTKIGQRGIKGIEIKEKHRVRLLPKIISENKNGNLITRERHDVFKYYGSYSGEMATSVDILYELWDKVYVRSSVDNKALINQRSTRTPDGTRISKKYYINQRNRIEVFNDNNIPSRLPKSSSVTLVIELIDPQLNELKSYYYKTVIIGDEFSLSDDGDYVIFGKNLKPIKETELNIKNKNEFSSYAREYGGIKSIKRDSENASYEYSNFSTPRTEITIDSNWLYNDKIDLNVNNNFSPKRYTINTYINESRLTNINLNLDITENTIQNDDGTGNIPDGNTAYIIIPSKIQMDVNQKNHDEIIGEGKVYLSEYSTRKNYDVWVDKNIQLSGNGNNINLNTRKLNGDIGGQNIGSDKEYLGIINESRKFSNPLKIQLYGPRFKGNPTNFRGSIKFYIKLK